MSTIIYYLKSKYCRLLSFSRSQYYRNIGGSIWNPTKNHVIARIALNEDRVNQGLAVGFECTKTQKVISILYLIFCIVQHHFFLHRYFFIPFSLQRLSQFYDLLIWISKRFLQSFCRLRQPNLMLKPGLKLCRD